VKKLAQTEHKLKRKHDADERAASYWWERSLEKVAESDKATQHHKTLAVIGNRWGGTSGARTGGLFLRKPLQEASQWPQRLLETRSTTLKRPTYFTSNSRAGAEPISGVHPDRRLAGMLCSLRVLKLAGGDERRALRRQPATNVRVSVRTGRPMRCGGCAFICC
jgi:hypothetical protein